LISPFIESCYNTRYRNSFILKRARATQLGYQHKLEITAPAQTRDWESPDRSKLKSKVMIHLKFKIRRQTISVKSGSVTCLDSHVNEPNIHIFAEAYIPPPTQSNRSNLPDIYRQTIRPMNQLANPVLLSAGTNANPVLLSAGTPAGTKCHSTTLRTAAIRLSFSQAKSSNHQPALLLRHNPNKPRVIFDLVNEPTMRCPTNKPTAC
jgi:hypothetical protein